MNYFAWLPTQEMDLERELASSVETWIQTYPLPPPPSIITLILGLDSI